jgi:hypothetical protein
MKRKHAELIKKWADGAEIQYRAVPGQGEWCKEPLYFIWEEFAEYRIKPEPKPDVVYYANFRKDLVSAYHIEKLKNDNLRLTFCAETGELKSAEVL